MKSHLVFVTILFFQTVCRADSPAPAVPLVFSSDGSDTFFAMSPPDYRYQGDKVVKIQEPYGVAYSLQPNGTFSELWRVKGWYTFEAFLSRDGHHLIRMGSWGVGKKPNVDDLAIAFYEDGNLIKQYSTSELVRDFTKVPTSVSHYFWLARDKPENAEFSGKDIGPRLDDSNKFILTTVDGLRYTFDIANGKTLERKLP